MNLFTSPSRVLLFSILSLCTSFVHADDIGDAIRDTDAGSKGKNGGFLEIGVAATLNRDIKATLNPDPDDDVVIELGLGLSLSAGYRYNRLFIEASESGFDGLNLGINMLESDHWSVDVLLANINGNITVESDEPPAPTTENERNQAILDRDSLFIAAGARFTGYFGDNIFQLRLVSDWHDDNGILGSARAGRRWQVGNWNVQAIAGVRYNSAEFNNYIYGVTSEEQSVRFPQYTAKQAWIPEVELGASVPVKENWVYSTRLRYRAYPSSVTNSPLVVENSDIILTSAIHYVF